MKLPPSRGTKGTPCPQVRATLRSHPCPVEQQRPSLGLQPSSASPSASFYFSPLPFTGVWVPRALPDSFLHANLDSVCCPENPLATVSGGGGKRGRVNKSVTFLPGKARMIWVMSMAGSSGRGDLDARTLVYRCTKLQRTWFWAVSIACRL